MKACREFLDDLLLDVYGEPVNDRAALDVHLGGCPGCRQERERLVSMIRRVREVETGSRPSPAETTMLRESILKAIRKEAGDARRQPRFLGMPLFPLPAFAAACLLVAAVGWFGLHEWTGSVPRPDGTPAELEERMIAQDLEILENMELLEELELIQKLVQIVDHGEAAL
jgi:hypothetical protein